MSAPARRHAYTFAQYLALEDSSNVKHEYLDGEIYAMAGGSPRHAALTAALGGALVAQLRGSRRRAFSADLRTRALASGLACYPDVTVGCGPLEHDPEDEDTVTNPKIVVEVLSRSTQAFDLDEKYDHYQRIPSLEAVLYVWQDETRMELRVRGGDGRWTARTFGAGAIVPLDAIGCRLDVDDVCRDAEMPTE